MVLDDPTDTEFWQRWGGVHSCTPLYYPAFLDRFPNAVCAVLAAITNAEPGGVLVHCASGRDRTGLIVLALLAALGVSAEDIADDYALSHDRRAEQCAALGLDDDTPKIRAFLAARGTTERALITELVNGPDFADRLRAGGLDDAGLAALRARVLHADRSAARPLRTVRWPGRDGP
ncbi:hypothetical protein GCM10009854_26470 [Saccharopolyspora halophila]|uniref:Tyrosine specific protein phosphatases domain-containing protein n=1 Tax=Saccharopolyspora halophila TaxID=405551 RepID=A0ABP5TE89_9PSEU